MMITLQVIGYVRNARRGLADDDWGGLVSEIDIEAPYGEESLQGIEAFSHAEVIFYFHQVDETEIERGARHPRGNTDWPKVGIFAQRAKGRPNRLGLATVRILRREGNLLYVRDLDAIDGTPVLDIKPVMIEFLPLGEVHQPEWAHELMANYWEGGER